VRSFLDGAVKTKLWCDGSDRGILLFHERFVGSLKLFNLRLEGGFGAFESSLLLSDPGSTISSAESVGFSKNGELLIVAEILVVVATRRAKVFRSKFFERGEIASSFIFVTFWGRRPRKVLDGGVSPNTILAAQSLLYCAVVQYHNLIAFHQLNHQK